MFSLPSKRNLLDYFSATSSKLTSDTPDVKRFSQSVEFISGIHPVKSPQKTFKRRWLFQKTAWQVIGQILFITFKTDHSASLSVCSISRLPISASSATRRHLLVLSRTALRCFTKFMRQPVRTKVKTSFLPRKIPPSFNDAAAS